MNSTAVLTDQLIDAYVLNLETEAGSREEAITTGAVFAVVRVIHALDLFDEVTRAAAKDLGLAPAELWTAFPNAVDATDAQSYFGSIA